MTNNDRPAAAALQPQPHSAHSSLLNAPPSSAFPSPLLSSTSSAPSSPVPPLSRLSYSFSTHLRSLLSSLSPSSYSSTLSELHSLLQLYGDDGYWYVVLLLLEAHQRDTSNPTSLSQPQAEVRSQLMRDVMREASDRDVFPALVSAAVEQAVSSFLPPPTSTSAASVFDLLDSFLSRSRVKAVWSAIIALRLAVSGGSAAVRDVGRRLLGVRVEELVGKRVHEGAGVDVSLHMLLSSLQSSGWQLFAPQQRRAVLLTLQQFDVQLSSALSSLVASLTSSLSTVDSSSSLYSSLSSSSPSAASLSVHRLSSLIRDLGYSSMASTDTLSDVLSNGSPLSEQDVAAIVIQMLHTADTLTSTPASLSLPHILSKGEEDRIRGGGGDGWRADVFIRTVWQLQPQLHWLTVLSLLDQPAFIVPSSRAASLLLQLHRHASLDQPFPLSLFLSPEWKHAAGRLSLLHWLCPLRWHSFPVHVLPVVRTADSAIDSKDTDELDGANQSSVLFSGYGSMYWWWSMDVLSSLQEVRSSSLQQQLSSLLSSSSSSSSSLLSSITHGDRVHVPVCVTLYPSTESRSIIAALLDTQPALLHTSLIALLHHTPPFVSSLLSSSHSLQRLLSLTPLAYREEMVHACTNKGQHQLSQFFTLSLKESLTSFLIASLNFLSSSLTTVSVAHLSVYFRHLYANINSLAAGDQSRLEEVYSRAAGMYATLPDYLLAVDEVEVSSLHYYQQLYSRTLSLPAFLTLLSTLRSSSSPRDKEVYASIIHTLFSEYPHLSSYPLPQLQLASLLFGCLISSFLTSLLRALALKLLLDALSSSSTKMRQFGCLALSQVRERLAVWPQYCQLLLGCEGLRQNEPRLWEWVRGVIEGAPVESVKEDVTEVREQLELQLVPAMRTGWVGVGPAHSLERESGLMALSVGGDEGSGRDYDVGWMTDDTTALEEGSEYGESSVHSHPTQSSFVPTRFTSTLPAVAAYQPSSSPLDIQNPISSYSRTGSATTDDAGARTPLISHVSSAAGLSGGDIGNGLGSSQIGRSQEASVAPPAPVGDSRSPSPPTPPPGLFNVKPSPPLSSTAAMPTYATATNATPAASTISSLPSSAIASSLAAPTTASMSSGAASTPTTPSRQPPSSAAPTFGSTLNIDSLLSAQRDNSKPLPLAPSDSIKDKIAFIINNVSATNLRSKGRELRALLKPEYYGYFARYLVIQRVSIEANFQKLYSSFLDAVDVEELNRAMIETTYDNIKVLLASDKVLSSSSERSLLKNLGSWLGLLTIAKNRPIRSKHLDLKALILEAFDSGRLIAVIPFCAKVLEACADSRVFRLPNPWLVGCAGLLKEIFDIPGLKLNLKFEIEVLFRTLGIVMRDIRASNLLRERAATSDFNSKAGQVTPGGAAAATAVRAVDRNGSGGAVAGVGPAAVTAAGAKAKRPSSPTGSTFTEESEEGSDALPGIGIPRATTPGGTLLPSTTSGFPPDASMLVPNLPTYVQINPTIPLFSMFSHLKRTVPTAIDRAIREIISPVVERSVTIACVTTRELIMKDFAFESDETKMRAAAHSMVQNLTSSLALVTCKEPLRVSINNHLGSLLEANATNANDANIKAAIEAACSTISNDNLELGCTLIEKAAAERAIREIDEALASAYTIRRKAREAGTPYLLYVQDPACKPYVDMSVFSSGRFPASLPEALRAKSSGLLTSQLRVYEDFSKRLQQPQQMLAPQQTAATAGQAADSRARQQYQPTAAGALVAGQPGAVDRGVASRDGVAFAAAGLAGLSSGSMAAPTGKLTGRSSPPPAANVAPVSRPVAVLPPTGNTRSPPLDPALPPQAAIPSSLGFTGLTSQQTLEKLVALLAQLEQAVLRFPNHKSIPLHSLTQPAAATGQPPLRDDHEIQVSLRMISQLLSSPPRDEANYPREVVALTFAHKVFKRLYDRENRTSLLQIDVHTAVLKFVKAVCLKVVQELTGWLLFGDDDRKFIIPITVALLRGRLLASAEVDAFLNKLVLALQSTGQAVQTVANPAAASSANVPPTIQVLHQHLDFVFALIRRVVIKRPILQAMELKQTLESLNALAHTSRHKLLQETIGHLLDDVRTAAINAEAAGQAVSVAERGVSVGVELKEAESKVGGTLYEEDMAASTAALSLAVVGTGGSGADDREDEAELASLRPTVAYLLDEWMNICIAGTASDKTYTAYLSLLHQQRMISTPDTTNRFFRCIIALCVESSLQQSGSDGQLSYTAIDALIKLFIFLVKFLDPPPPPNQQHTNHNKIRLLSSFLTASATVLRRDFQRSKGAFDQKPYLRLFNNL